MIRHAGARPRLAVRTLLVALTTLLLALAMAAVPARAAGAADSDDLYIDAYLGYGSSGTRLFVDFQVLNGAVTDATSVRVTVKRTVGPDVVKVSKATATHVLDGVNSGSFTTAPIVIQPGTTDEAASSSWEKPDAIWTAETVPTSVTVEILNAGGVALSRTVPAPTSTYGLTIAEVLPPAPTMAIRSTAYRNDASYKGISVNFEVTGFADAEQVRVEVERSDGSSIVKIAKQTIVDDVNDGTYRIVSAPIVMQQGTYNEAGSGSWYLPTGVWTSQTVPERITVTITRAYGDDVVKTSTSFPGSAEGVLPAPSDPVKVVVPTEQPGGGSYDVVIPEGQTGGELDLGGAVDGKVTVPLEVNVVSPLGVTVTLPKDVTVTATGPDAATWDGVILLPTAVEDVEIPGRPAEVGLAIEVGSPTARLTFGAPVKLVLAGQAGKSAGFIQGGVYTAIDTRCSANPPVDLVDGECWIDEGDDLVIWTTHFTTFVAFSSVLAVSGGSLPAPLVGAVVVLAAVGAGLVLLGRARRRTAA